MYTFETQVRVRYAETDKMGYAYYGNYATYYEVARVEALRNLGIAYKEIEDTGVVMPVIESKSKYLKPAIYDQLLTIKIAIPKKPGVKITFSYEITNEQEELINTGETTLVFIDVKTGKPIMIPDTLEKIFNPFFS